eukprot:12410806-Karenia_brevis.AAC.1
MALQRSSKTRKLDEDDDGDVLDSLWGLDAKAGQPPKTDAGEERRKRVPERNTSSQGRGKGSGKGKAQE